MIKKLKIGKGPTLTQFLGRPGDPDFNLIFFLLTFLPVSLTTTSPPTSKLCLFVYQNMILNFTLVASSTLKLTVDPFDTASSAAVHGSPVASTTSRR